MQSRAERGWVRHRVEKHMVYGYCAVKTFVSTEWTISKCLYVLYHEALTPRIDNTYIAPDTHNLVTKL